VPAPISCDQTSIHIWHAGAKYVKSRCKWNGSLEKSCKPPWWWNAADRALGRARSWNVIINPAPHHKNQRVGVKPRFSSVASIWLTRLAAEMCGRRPPIPLRTNPLVPRATRNALAIPMSEATECVASVNPALREAGVEALGYVAVRWAIRNRRRWRWGK